MKSTATLFLLILFSQYTYAQTWQDVGGGTNNSSHGMCVWNGKLVNVGSFNNPCQKVATWNESVWECLGGGVGLVGRAAIEWNGNLVVVGDFWNNFQPCTDCNGIGVWDGVSWTPLGTGFNNDVLCLAIWNGDLVAGGDFTEADGLPCSRVARWDGTTWQPIGGPADFDNDIRCMVEFDGEFWVGGDFNNVGGCTACDGLVKWNGTNWVGGNSGVDIQGGVDSTVRVLYVNPNDGNLYMGGHFTDLSIDGVVTAFNGVAMYDGSVWTPLGSGVDSYVRMIHEYNGNLIVGGDFNTASGVPANKVAKWNPLTSTWSAMDTGMNGYIKAGTVYNGTFYAGGDFTTASGLTRNFIASWYEIPSVPPVAGINSSGTTICEGNCLSFSDFSTNSPTSWLWSFPGSSTPSSSSQNPGSICYPSSGTYTISLEACNGSGCDISIMDITVTGIPSVSFSDVSICEGESVILSAVPSVPGGSYSWAPGGGTTQSINVSPVGTTNYSVTYTLNGCSSAPFNGAVTVNDVPSLAISSPTTICSGTTIDITATPSLSGGNLTWSPGGQTLETISVSPASTTTYIASYTLNGCDAADVSVIITVNQTPVVSVNNPAICEGDVASLVATPSAGGGDFNWLPGGENTASIDVSPTTTTTYSVSYSLNGCSSDIVPATVTITAIPVVAVSDASICSGESVDLTAITSLTGGDFSWSPGGLTGQMVSVSPVITTVYTVNYTLNGCDAIPVNATVNVTETPVVTVNSETICEGETVSLVAVPSASGGDFVWTPNGEISSSIDVSPSSNTNYSVSYTLDGCTSIPATSVVTVNPMPSALVDQTDFVLSAQQNGAIYQWLRCTDMIVLTGETSQAFTATVDGQYAVSVNLNGCIDTSDCKTILGVGLSENNTLELVKVFPNPITDEVTLVFNDDLIGSSFTIYDASGRQVFVVQITSVSQTVNLQELNSGIYYLVINNLVSERTRLVKL